MRWMIETAGLGSNDCIGDGGAFARYFCRLSFPLCGDDPGGSGDPTLAIQLPICWDYCVGTEIACSLTPELAAAACDMAVQKSVVSPPGYAGTCVSRAARRAAGRLLTIWAGLAAAAALRAAPIGRTDLYLT